MGNTSFDINSFCGVFLYTTGVYIIGGRRYLRLGGGTNDGACVSTHTLGGCGGMLPQKIFKIRCCEIAFEAIFALKFIFGLDAAGIPSPSSFGVPLAMFRDR